MRGEHALSMYPRARTLGSSPHARGTRSIRRTGMSRGRIIPACAGNTAEVRRRNVRARDHPRMRGEHLQVHHVSEYATGSSPHARGTLDWDIKPDGLPGIIPACAGNTRFGADRRIARRDHPRMRGEHAVAPEMTSFEQGSSPHARGTPDRRRRRRRRRGIIPACAGNTVLADCACVGLGDHPRMRGEHSHAFLTI